MTSDAIHSRVRADQRETVFMGTHRLKRDIPSDDAMAFLAIRAELATMNVGVTVGTLCAYVAKNKLGVALDAIHPHMHAAKRITRLVVVKFRDGPDWLPARLRVAVFAGDGERSVRAARLRIGRTTVLSLG